MTAQNGNGEPIDLELLLLPLGASRPSLARTIGILAPLTIPQWLGSSPIGASDAGRPPPHRGGGRDPLLPRFMAAQRRHLVVHEGGRI